jgi:hypothetical protein
VVWEDGGNGNIPASYPIHKKAPLKGLRENRALPEFSFYSDEDSLELFLVFQCLYIVSVDFDNQFLSRNFSTTSTKAKNLWAF